MNQVLLQIWEESELNCSIKPDGCSLHFNEICHKNYINSVLDKRIDCENVPEIYESFVGEPVYAFVNDVIYSIVQRDKNIRLSEPEMNNLLGLKEIEIVND